jgi:hypothetical protein
LQQLIVDTSRESAGKSWGQRRSPGFASENSLTMQRVRSRLLAGEKDRAHLYAFRAKSEGCGDTASIRYAAGGNNRNLYRIDCLRHQ